ncbi:hypothetical protein ILUMI_08136 [Ignelater luminosus]|uniref:Translation initiation factor 3 N-terminal domain-containing protein n=1 Tax=Ignelater luminosus TaxID=2038154 RepID=A0A8K0D261_IGNLU|nr:hypothetical protein ILUMI_08136 [Ignelater luminosus]
MFSRTFNGLKILTNQKSLYLKFTSITCQQRIFSSKPPVQPFQKTVDGEQQKKSKRQPIPKITLISSDDNISITTLEEAQQLSKRRDLKLVKIVDLDTKTQRPVYKLMTGAEYHSEEIKQREQKKKEKQSNAGALKGEKLLMLNSGISKHDLETNIKKILKWILKRYEVRVVISGDVSSMEKSESVYKFLEDSLKENTRFLQKRTKGSDLKFQIIPPKDDTGKQNKPNKTL